MTPIGNVKPSLAKELKEQFEPKFYPIQRILQKINERSKKYPDAVFNDLYPLLTNEFLLLQALGNIRPNKGMNTPGVDHIHLNEFSFKKIKLLALELKNKSFKFSPVKRIYIPKPGKKKMRPLGIPTLKDRIVQEAIRMILEAIYEPVFETLKYQNFGFRPKKSCQKAIKFIQRYSTSCTYAIEGDIVGAYDNIQIPKLISILNTRIKDNKFLQFIKEGCYSGLMDMGKYQDTLLGVLQGGICSPILFNIYMHEFDYFINYKFQDILDRYNLLHDRSNRDYKNPEYKRINGRIEYYNKRIGIIAKTGFKPNNNPILKSLIEKKQSLTKERLSIPAVLINKREIKITYSRYADDWIILTNANKKFTEMMLKHIDKWFDKNLSLKLSPEKTLITNISTDHAKFLGFTIKTYTAPKLSISKKTKNLIRSGQYTIKIGIDMDRVLKKLTLFGFCNEKFKPIGKRGWSVLPEREILFKYNAILSGSANYYIPVIDCPWDFTRIQYILEYSCYGTIANKRKTTTFKLMTLFGKPPVFTSIMQSKDRLGQVKEVTQKFSVNSYLTNKSNALKLKSKSILSTDSNLFKPMNKVNWRTYKNLNAYCLICGTKENQSC